MVELSSREAMEILTQQRQFFFQGKTKDLKFRIDSLKALKAGIEAREGAILEALLADLGKGAFEAYSTEVGFVLKTIRETIRFLGKWAKPEKIRTPIYQFPSRGYIYREPYGVVLIIGPFNYPFQLLIEPLVGALAAGNCAVLKPSESTPRVSALVKEMIQDLFPPEYVQVVEGARDTTSALIHCPFDYIFFTGSARVGKVVMKAAAENLVPVTLELGGKSPVIVDKTANLPLAAKRIAWGKLLNVGQTCIAPDYALVHQEVKEAFLQVLVETIRGFYGDNPLESKDYGRIVNEGHLKRLLSLIDPEKNKILLGGDYDLEQRYLAPTVIDQVSWEDPIMEEEIFGPLLPVLTYEDLDDIIEKIQKRPKPLALYLFTQDLRVEKRVLKELSFGGGCVNDTISHVTAPNLPFGGVGHSGMGAYHGKESFLTFSHRKSVLKKANWLDLKLVFPPYGERVALVKKILK